MTADAMFAAQPHSSPTLPLRAHAKPLMGLASGRLRSSCTMTILATAVVIPIVFVVGAILCQWALWIFDAVFDPLSPIFGAPGYDPENIGLLQQIFRDLAPVVAAWWSRRGSHQNTFPTFRWVIASAPASSL